MKYVAHLPASTSSAVVCWPVLCFAGIADTIGGQTQEREALNLNAASVSIISLPPLPPTARQTELLPRAHARGGPFSWQPHTMEMSGIR